MHALFRRSIWFVLALGTPALARGEPVPDATGHVLTRNAEAVSAGRAALEAYQRGEWDAAYQQLQRAETLAHSPVFVLYMARSKERQGALVEALGIYARLAAEPVSRAAPEAWRLAVDSARVEYAALARRVPSVFVRLAPNHATDTIVTLDGMQLHPLGEELLLDPGAHVVVARRSDGTETRQRLTLREGQKRQRVELSFPRQARHSGGLASTVSAKPPLLAWKPHRPTATEPRPSRGRGVYAVVAFSSAVALLSASGYFAWRADQASERVSSAFARNQPWSESLAASERDGERSQTIAIAALGGGLLAAGIGTWVIVFD